MSSESPMMWRFCTATACASGSPMRRPGALRVERSHADELRRLVTRSFNSSADDRALTSVACKPGVPFKARLAVREPSISRGGLSVAGTSCGKRGFSPLRQSGASAVALVVLLCRLDLPGRASPRRARYLSELRRCRTLTVSSGSGVGSP
jgi:hypothetical protein